MQQFAQQQKLMQQNMQREQGEMEMNGNRPGSPSSADNAGSPNKRPRLEGGQFNGQQMAPNGRGQGMPNQAANNSIQMMMKNGINPQGMTPAQFQSFQNQNPAVQQKSIQVYAQNLAQHHNRSAMNQGAMPNGMMNPGGMPNQGSPMLQPMNENFMMDPNYNPAVNAQIRPGMPQPAGGQGGNHALQDYQMQLMLLEQQNKKRLMMARQEQDSMTRADGQPGIPAQQGMQPPGMSPSGSRNGPSPNPSDQMKRTPQLGQTGLPGSPTPGGPGGSPAPMNFNGQMPQDFNSQMFAMGKMGEGMMPGQGIRPPGQMNPNMQAGRMPANWQGGPQGQPVMQQPGQGQPQNVGTPQQTREMPPPQAPAPNAGRGTQPSSPSTSNQAPPTPQQANKANPTKGKKGKANSEKVSRRNSSWSTIPKNQTDISHSVHRRKAQPPTPLQQTPTSPANLPQRPRPPPPSLPSIQTPSTRTKPTLPPTRPPTLAVQLPLHNPQQTPVNNHLPAVHNNLQVGPANPIPQTPTPWPPCPTLPLAISTASIRHSTSTSDPSTPQTFWRTSISIPSSTTLTMEPVVSVVSISMLQAWVWMALIALKVVLKFELGDWFDRTRYFPPVRTQSTNGECLLACVLACLLACLLD